MRYVLVFAVMILITACSSTPTMKTVERVNLDRFMGKWYVIGNIPTFIEREAYNAVEIYCLDEDGTIDTTFIFQKGGFDGPKKTYNPRGFIRNRKTNAHWGMQFIWPFKAEYLIVYLNEDYTHTVIGRSSMDYLWIMARTPAIPDEDYRIILDRIASLGYDISKIRKVPQKWER
ncbi:MAG: lipocalin family protein [Spirochaetota bacterium]